MKNHKLSKPTITKSISQSTIVETSTTFTNYIDILLEKNNDLVRGYRVIVNGVGIYEAVAKASLEDREKAGEKPDGSWLPKVGMNYPGKTSYWTDYGYKYYKDSGLMKWHLKVVNAKPIIIQKNIYKNDIVYQDIYQIIV